MVNCAKTIRLVDIVTRPWEFIYVGRFRQPHKVVRMNMDLPVNDDFVVYFLYAWAGVNLVWARFERRIQRELTDLIALAALALAHFW